MTFGDLDFIEIDFVGSHILIKYSLILFDENITSKQITDTDKGISGFCQRQNPRAESKGSTFAFFAEATLSPSVRTLRKLYFHFLSH